MWLSVILGSFLFTLSRSVEIGVPLVPQTDCYEPILRVVGNESHYMNSSQFIDFVFEVNNYSGRERFGYVNYIEEFPVPLNETFQNLARLCNSYFEDEVEIPCLEDKLRVKGAIGNKTNPEFIYLYHVCSDTIVDFTEATDNFPSAEPSSHPTLSLVPSTQPSFSPSSNEPSFAPSLRPSPDVEIVQTFETNFGIGWNENSNANTILDGLEIAFDRFVQQMEFDFNNRTFTDRFLQIAVLTVKDSRIVNNADDLTKIDCPSGYQESWVCYDITGKIDFTTTGDNEQLAEEFNIYIEEQIENGNLRDAMLSQGLEIGFFYIVEEDDLSTAAIIGISAGAVGGALLMISGFTFMRSNTRRGGTYMKSLDLPPNPAKDDLDDCEELQNEGCIEDPLKPIISDWEHAISQIFDSFSDSDDSNGDSDSTLDNSFQDDDDPNGWVRTKTCSSTSSDSSEGEISVPPMDII